MRYLHCDVCDLQVLYPDAPNWYAIFTPDGEPITVLCAQHDPVEKLPAAEEEQA